VFNVEMARIVDVGRMQELINGFASREEMLPRSLSEIYENIRDYFVVRDDDRVVGCGSLHVCWADMAEIKSMAVEEKRQGQGIGTALVASCITEAGRIGIDTVFCLTYKPDFFSRFGFKIVDKMELPRKVWTECYHCPKFPDCDEVAMVRRVENA
jgi:amino-acid N-acetyltransferase